MANRVPNEHVVITFVSYLCSRLLLIGEESRAAIVIQRIWRRKHAAIIAAKQATAVVILQRVTRGFLVRIKLQRYKFHVNELMLIMSRIRAAVKAYIERKRFLTLRASTIKLQVITQFIVM